MRTSLGGCRISSRRAGLALSLPSIAARGCINLCHICTRNSHTINRPMKEKDQPVNELYEDPALVSRHTEFASNVHTGNKIEAKSVSNLTSSACHSNECSFVLVECDTGARRVRGSLVPHTWL